MIIYLPTYRHYYLRRNIMEECYCSAMELFPLLHPLARIYNILFEFVRMKPILLNASWPAKNEQNLEYVPAEMAYGLLQLVITRNVP